MPPYDSSKLGSTWLGAALKTISITSLGNKLLFQNIFWNTCAEVVSESTFWILPSLEFVKFEFDIVAKGTPNLLF